MDQKLADIIELAIKREQEAYDFYMDILNRVSDSTTRDTLEWIAAEEKKHEAFLVSYRDGSLGSDALRMSTVVSYKIAENLAEPDVGEDMSSQDVFLVAAHREARSHAFYTQLAGLHAEGEAKAVLLKMANEELKHKEKMEYLYSNTAFPQTSGG